MLAKMEANKMPTLYRSETVHFDNNDETQAYLVANNLTEDDLYMQYGVKPYEVPGVKQPTRASVTAAEAMRYIGARTLRAA